MSEALWATRPRPLDDGTAFWRGEPTTLAELRAMRMQLRDQLRADGGPAGASSDDIDRLLLAFEELASNGLRHSGAPVEVRVDGCDRGWLIEVSDSRPELPPAPAVDRDPALGGLGLHLVARLSVAFGWAVDGNRKRVWAALLPA